MSESINERLSRAFNLIEAGKHPQAREILEPMLNSQQDNPDVWWLYAHAVEDMAPAEDALARVKSLEPNYPGATDLLQTIATRKETQGPITTSLSDIDGADFVNRSSLEDDFDSNALEDEDEDSTPQSRQQMLTLLAVPIILVLLLIVIFVVINPFGSDDEDTPEPTQSAQIQATAAGIIETPAMQLPTATPEFAETPAIADDVESALSDAGLVVLEGETSVEQTELFGSTLLASVCSGAGAQLRDSLETTLTAMAGAVGGATEDVDAVGARFVDCSADNAILNIIAVDIAAATDFAAGGLTQEEFRAEWRPVG